MTAPTAASAAPALSAAPYDPDVVPGLRRGIRSLRSLRVSDWVAFAVVAVLVVAVVAPGVLSPVDPLDDTASRALESPGSGHWAGTDYLGRDVLSRIVHGAGTTLSASVVAVVLGLVGGVLLGVVSGYLGGRVDSVISRIIDVLLSVPGLLLAMVIVVAMGFGALNAAIAVGVSSVASFARVVRAEVLRVRTSPYVEAAQHYGAPWFRTLRVHILPNSLGAVASLVPLQLGAAVIWISSLSFLGFGAVPPDPEWGLLVNEGRDYVLSAPWLLLFPGLAIVVTVVSVAHLQRTAVRIRKELH